MGQNDFFYAGGGGAAAGGGAAISIGGNTSGTTALVSSGTLVLQGGTNITLSQNGNTIQINGPAALTLQQWWPPSANGGGQSQSFNVGIVQLCPVFAHNYVTATRANCLLSVSVSTSSNSSHAGTLSFQVAFYTNNASTLSLASQGSTFYVWTNTSDNSSASLQGAQRVLSVPINVNMSPGAYWFAIMSSSASANANWITMRNIGVGAPSQSGSFGGASSGTNNMALGLGHYTVSTASFPVSMSFSEIRVNGTADGLYFLFTLQNTT